MLVKVGFMLTECFVVFKAFWRSVLAHVFCWFSDLKQSTLVFFTFGKNRVLQISQAFVSDHGLLVSYFFFGFNTFFCSFIGKNRI